MKTKAAENKFTSEAVLKANRYTGIKNIEKGMRKWSQVDLCIMGFFKQVINILLIIEK